MANTNDQYIKMTQTPILPLVVKLSIPTIISMVVTNIYNLADTAFVGMLGNSQSGAVGVVFGFMSIIQAIGFMFGQGSGSIISRALGQSDSEKAIKTASTGFFLAFFIGIAAALLSFVFIDSLVMRLGSTETIAPYAKTYIMFILMAAPFMTTSFLLNNILRFEGKAALGMIGLMTGGILNIFGDALFMFGFKMGIEGAGLSTALSQLISFSILLSMFLRGKTVSKISIKKVSLVPKEVFNIMATGFPSLLRQGLNSWAITELNLRASVYGDEAVAAMSIVSRIVFFVFSVALGIGQGFQPVCGFNYGAGKYSRVKKGYVITFALAETLMAIAAVAVLINSGQLIGIFRNDAKVIEIGTRALQLQVVTSLTIPFCMVTEMMFQSTGHKLGASLLSSMRSGLCFIPTLIILAKLRGLAGIQEAQPLAFVLSAIPSLFFMIWFFKNLPKDA